MSTPKKTPDTTANLLAEKTERLKIAELDLKRLQKEVLDARIIRREIFKLAEAQPDLPGWTKAAEKGSLKGPGCPIAFASDWHWGENIVPDQIGGVNEYTMEIAHARAKRFFQRIVALLKNHMVRPEYPGIVLCLGGDMLSGNIHQELAETNEIGVMPAMLDLFGVMVEGIDLLVKEFGRVTLPCVSGNHARNTLKMQSKERCHTNFDWLLCQILEKHYEKNKSVEFAISNGVDKRFQAFGHTFLLSHGDTMGKGGDGIIGCLGPIIRGDQKTRARNGQIGQPYDTLLIGHYHQLMWIGKKVISNGSLCGYNEFASNTLRAPFEVPQQALFCVHPEHGITYQMPILVEPTKVNKNTKWVSWEE